MASSESMTRMQNAQFPHITISINGEKDSSEEYCSHCSARSVHQGRVATASATTLNEFIQQHKDCEQWPEILGGVTGQWITTL